MLPSATDYFHGVLYELFLSQVFVRILIKTDVAFVMTRKVAHYLQALKSDDSTVLRLGDYETTCRKTRSVMWRPITSPVLSNYVIKKYYYRRFAKKWAMGKAKTVLH